MSGMSQGGSPVRRGLARHREAVVGHIFLMIDKENSMKKSFYCLVAGSAATAERGGAGDQREWASREKLH